jgi:hypothetical protein
MRAARATAAALPVTVPGLLWLDGDEIGLHGRRIGKAAQGAAGRPAPVPVGRVCATRVRRR